MKTTKKIFAILLAVMLVVSLAANISAAGSGTITITNATVGKDYGLYKVFDADVDPVDDTKVIYTYTATGATDPFLVALQASGSPFTVTLKSGNVYNVYSEESAEDITTFLTAQKTAGNLTQIGTDVTASTSTVVFSGVDAGYYFITSTLGSEVTITTSKPSAEVIDKNGLPGPGPDPDDPTGKHYKVLTDSTFATTDTDGKNSASYGDTVYYQLQLATTNYKGADLIYQYVAHDKVDAGIELDTSNIKVLVDGVDITIGCTIDTAPTDGDTFDVTIPWASSGTPLYSNGAVVYVQVTGTVTTAAVPGTPVTNSGVFSYNDETAPTPAVVETTTYSVDVVKTDGSNLLVPGAKFKLYDASTGGNVIKVTKDSDGVYHVDASGSEEMETNGGLLTIKGLAGDTSYYLEETFAPAGYVALTSRQEIALTDANLTATVSGSTYESGGVQIINEKMGELPSTGGIGTTIFYVVGSVLVLGAVLLLITKKRVNADK